MSAADAHAESSHEHPSNLFYVQVAIVLAAFTGVEVAMPYITDVKGPVIALMLTIMVVKFGVVAALFMHLRYDSMMFRQFFIAGLVLAAVVYIGILMTAFQFFGDNTTSEPLDERPHPAVITR